MFLLLPFKMLCPTRLDGLNRVCGKIPFQTGSLVVSASSREGSYATFCVARTTPVGSCLHLFDMGYPVKATAPARLYRRTVLKMDHVEGAPGVGGLKLCKQARFASNDMRRQHYPPS